MRNLAGALAQIKAVVPAIFGVIVFSFCTWWVHQDAVNRLKQPDRVDITVYGPDGTIIPPVFHR